MIKVLQFVNTIPAEPFLHTHLQCLKASGKFTISWGAIQRITDTTQELNKQFKLKNYYRLPLYKKAYHYLFHHKDRVNKAAITQINNEQPDVIHFHFGGIAVRLAPLAEKLGIPFTMSLRGSDIRVFPHTLSGYKEDLITAAKKAHGIHTTCDAFKKQLVEWGIEPQKIHTIRTVIDRSWFNTSPPPVKKHLMSHGRYHWTKSYEDLLFAINGLPDATGIIFGSGPEQKSLSFLIRDLELNDRVELSHFANHGTIRDTYANGGVFILPSISEGFPNSLAEAMALGLPIITTNIGGINEVIENGKNGLLIEPGKPEEIKEKANMIFADKNLAKQLGENARETAATVFNTQQHLEGFTNLWKI